MAQKHAGDEAPRAELDGVRRENEEEQVILADHDARLQQTAPPPMALPSITHASSAMTTQQASPRLPYETFLETSKYLDPGTRSFLNLLMSCRTMYELLQGRFFESLNARRISRAIARLLATNIHDQLRIPSGIELVKHLDAGWPEFIPVNELKSRPVDPLVKFVPLAQRLQSLRCGLLLFRALWSSGHQWSHLSSLDLNNAGYNISSALTRTFRADAFENLRTLQWSGYPSIALMRSFGDLCPRLERIECNFFSYRGQLDVELLPENFVAKIRSWVFLGEHDPLPAIVGRFGFPRFAPEEIYACEPQFMDEAFVRSVCTLPSIRKLWLGVVESSALLPNFPPGIEQLQVERLLLTIFRFPTSQEREAKLDQLAKVLASLKAKGTRIFVKADLWFMADAVQEVANPDQLRALHGEHIRWTQRLGSDFGHYFDGCPDPEDGAWGDFLAYDDTWSSYSPLNKYGLQG